MESNKSKVIQYATLPWSIPFIENPLIPAPGFSPSVFEPPGSTLWWLEGFAYWTGTLEQDWIPEHASALDMTWPSATATFSILKIGLMLLWPTGPVFQGWYIRYVINTWPVCISERPNSAEKIGVVHENHMTGLDEDFP